MRLPDGWTDVWRESSPQEFRRWLGSFDVRPKRRIDGTEAVRGASPHSSLLDYRLLPDDDSGVVAFAWVVPEVLLNPAGIAHGGFLAAILDDAAGLAVTEGFARWVPHLTVHLSVDYLAPVLPDIEHRVEGELIRHGRSSSLGDSRILDPDGKLCARASGVFQPNRRMMPRELWADAGL